MTNCARHPDLALKRTTPRSRPALEFFHLEREQKFHTENNTSAQLMQVPCLEIRRIKYFISQNVTLSFPHPPSFRRPTTALGIQPITHLILLQPIRAFNPSFSLPHPNCASLLHLPLAGARFTQADQVGSRTHRNLVCRVGVCYLNNA